MPYHPTDEPPRRSSLVLSLRPLLAVATIAVGLAGCAKPPTPPTPPYPPQADDLLSVEQLVSAASGATIDIPNGASLTIPPGALAVDTMIKITVPEDPTAQYLGDVYVLEPNGLVFQSPATLTIPVPLGTADTIGDFGDPLLSVFLVSDLHTPFDAGSELAIYEKAKIIGRNDDTGTLDIELDHFSVLFAYMQVDELAYLVTDIPPKYLEPADLFFTLTKIGFIGSFEQDGPNWAPGHVGVFAPRAGKPGDKKQGKLIEATPDQVTETDLTTFKSDTGHLFLGPRRVAGGLSAQEQQAAVTFVRDQRGKGYSAVLGQGNLTSGSYSCVGLAEATLDSVNRGALNIAQEATVSSPLELFRSTVPVREPTLYVGEHVDFQVYGVVVDPDSWSFSPISSNWDYYCACQFDIAAANLPSGATFTGTEPLDHGPPGSYSYRFDWTPAAQHANKTFSVTLQMGYTVEYLTSVEYELMADELLIHVLPLSGETVTSVVLDTELVVSDSIRFVADDAISLERIEGGRIVEGHAGCGEGDPHLHAEGEGIYIDTVGPIPDPNPEGCGYGTVVDVPVEHVD